MSLKYLDGYFFFKGETDFNSLEAEEERERIKACESNHVHLQTAFYQTEQRDNSVTLCSLCQKVTFGQWPQLKPYLSQPVHLFISQFLQG